MKPSSTAEPNYPRMLEIVGILKLEYVAPRIIFTTQRWGPNPQTYFHPARFNFTPKGVTDEEHNLWVEFHLLLGNKNTKSDGTFSWCPIRDPEVARFFEAHHRLGY